MNLTEVINFLSKFGGLTASGVLLLVLWLFMTGKIRPAKHLEEFRQDFSKILEHKDREIDWWRNAYDLQAKRGDKQEEALRETAEVGRTVLTILHSLHSAKGADNERR